jgi:tetratricopeptide (TPR) repeat protein
MPCVSDSGDKKPPAPRVEPTAPAQPDAEGGRPRPEPRSPSARTLKSGEEPPKVRERTLFGMGALSSRAPFGAAKPPSSGAASPAPPRADEARADQARADPARVDAQQAPGDDGWGVDDEPTTQEPSAATRMVDELRLRGLELERSGDAVAAARVFVEVGIVQERALFDRAAARKSYETARSKARTLSPALTRLRRVFEARGERAQAAQSILDDELAATEDDATRADLLAERGRLLVAQGRATDAQRAFREALAVAPAHASALRGLELSLRAELARAARAGHAKEREQAAVDLASVLERLASLAAGASQADVDLRLASWLHVERGELAERVLDKAEVARAALTRAVELEPEPGPARDALVRHLVFRREPRELAMALAHEAAREPEGDRSARLYYLSARLLAELGDATLAADLLERGAKRAPSDGLTARRLMAELVRVLEGAGGHEAAAHARRRQLALLDGPEAQLVEHEKLAEAFDAMGKPDLAAHHALAALSLDARDDHALDLLDRAHQRLGQHEARVALWTRVGNDARPVAERVRALELAADIAERHLRRRADAIALYRAAFALDPSDVRVFGALTALFMPPKPGEQARRDAEARIELYRAAADAATDPVRVIALEEKLVSIYEDELLSPERALEHVERILALEPSRKSALLALGRNAERTGDGARLARALLAEAELTARVDEKRALLLRAARVLADRNNDVERARATLERALALDPKSLDVLTEWQALETRAGRFEEARKHLLRRIELEPDPAVLFVRWLEVATLDEARLRRPHDAVEALRKAAKLRPKHARPRLEIARILRAARDHRALDAALSAVAEDLEGREAALTLSEAAEALELCLGDDAAANERLRQAERKLGAGLDAFLLESQLRIAHRHADPLAPPGVLLPSVKRGLGARAELVALYERALEAPLGASTELARRVALGRLLAESHAGRAVTVLEAGLGTSPPPVPALRTLEQVHRAAGAHAPLAAVLRLEVGSSSSRVARRAALWELAMLEEHLGPALALEALRRAIDEDPLDRGALDGAIRIASKLVSHERAQRRASEHEATLIELVRRRRELVSEPTAHALYELEETLAIEAASPTDAVSLRVALDRARHALSLYPEGLSVARTTLRLAEKLRVPEAELEARVALGRLARDAVERARHWLRAAELTTELGRGSPVELYAEALSLDADLERAVVALAQLLVNDASALVERLHPALGRAKTPAAITTLGTEIGRAVLRHRGAHGAPDAGVGVSAMKRVLAVAPRDAEALLLQGRLLIAQASWAEANATLRQVIELGGKAHAVPAHLLLAEVLEGPLADAAGARASLEAVLVHEPASRVALDRLLDMGERTNDHALAIRALRGLVDVTDTGQGRVDLLLRASDHAKAANDEATVVHLLGDAMLMLPSDGRAFSLLRHRYRTDTREGARAFVQAIEGVLTRARERQAAIDPRWLSAIGLVEAATLLERDASLAHLRAAVATPGAHPDCHVALGRGLELHNRNAEAVSVLREVLGREGDALTRVSELSHALAALEAALAKEGRAAERQAVEEVRAAVGELSPEREARMRSRRLTPEAPHAQGLAGPELGRVLVPEARTVLLDVCFAVSPIVAKALRIELATFGLSSRDRVGTRDGGQVRVVAERVARAFSPEAFELYLSAGWTSPPRAIPGDPGAIVLPASFADAPEPEQLFMLGRCFFRLVTGTAFVGDLPPDALDGLLLGAVRAVVPTFAQAELGPGRERAVATFAPPLAKAMGRRQKKLLEEIAPSMTSAFDVRPFVAGLAKSELYAGLVASGDLLAGLEVLRREHHLGAEPKALLRHPATAELLRFALAGESALERQRVGTLTPIP